jgi:hypothetical protein
MTITIAHVDREKQSYWAVRGSSLETVADNAAASPGTEVTLSSLNIAQPREVVIQPSAVLNSTTYSFYFTSEAIKVPYLVSYTSDSTATLSEIVDELESQLAVDSNLTLTNTGSTVVVQGPAGYSFSFTRLNNIDAIEITPLIASSAFKFDLLFENKGSNTMYVIQNSRCLAFVPAGVMLQIVSVDPYSGSLFIVGDPGDTFELLALEYFNNTKV